jgi:hypothetical protein
MKHKIIRTENYLLVVDNDTTKAKEGYWLYRNDIEVAYCNKDFWFDFKEPYKKIIAHLPLNNSPILDGVDLLPPLEDELEKLAKEWFDVGKYSSSFIADVNSFKEGYNKAKEKYKYTKDDVIKIVEKSRKTGLTAEYLMLSLQKPKMPIGFECKMEWENSKGEKGSSFTNVALYEENIKDYDAQLVLKTTINSQGLTQWVGKYIY